MKNEYFLPEKALHQKNMLKQVFPPLSILDKG